MHAIAQRRKPRAGWEAEQHQARVSGCLRLAAEGHSAEVICERLGITQEEWLSTYRKAVWRHGLGQGGFAARTEGEDMAKAKQEAPPQAAPVDEGPKVRLAGLARVEGGLVVVEADVPASQVRVLNPGASQKPLPLAAAVQRLRVTFGEMVRGAVVRRKA